MVLLMLNGLAEFKIKDPVNASRNNPPDGSNWENLCIYCHDDEHSRGLLGDYLYRKGGEKS